MGTTTKIIIEEYKDICFTAHVKNTKGLIVQGESIPNVLRELAISYEALEKYERQVESTE